MSGHQQYIGEELELFRHAINWKKYVAAVAAPYIRGSVAEIGAGTGNFSPYLQQGISSWTYVEPDGSFRVSLAEAVKAGKIAAGDIVGGLAELAEGIVFDTVLYLDVLEHIANDGEELRHTVHHIRTGGHLVILSPAFNQLYSPFDKAIGHYRRYTRKRLADCFPVGGAIVLSRYLDSVGFFSSLANKVVLGQKYPTLRQIKAWDSLMVPTSRFIDPIFSRFFGRSVLAVWQKQ